MIFDCGIFFTRVAAGRSYNIHIWFKRNIYKHICNIICSGRVSILTGPYIIRYGCITNKFILIYKNNETYFSIFHQPQYYDQFKTPLPEEYISINLLDPKCFDILREFIS